jgi:D-threonate/D-erythronate kinase
VAAVALRLIADDLTGALDTAAQFSGATGPVAVRFRPGDWRAAESRLAFSTDTRDRSGAEAQRVMAELARFFAGADIAFLKVDSLLRGHAAASLAHAFRNGGFRSCVFAPAFPDQQRITRGGTQLARALDGTWRDVRPGFLAELAAAELRVRLVAEAAGLGGTGVFVCDAETHAELTEIVAHAIALVPPLLWCGSAGLARALANAPVPRAAVPAAPLLAIIGSDHPVTRAQVEALRRARQDAMFGLGECTGSVLAVREQLERGGVAVVTFSLRDGLDERQAAQRISALLAESVPRLPRPRGLFVAGGATLAAVASAAGATGFTVGGEVAPGLPCSLLRGGAWDGVRVVSKSGAFGDVGLLARIVAGVGAPLAAA